MALSLENSIYRLLKIEGNCTKLEIVQGIYKRYTLAPGREIVFEMIETLVQRGDLDLIPLSHHEVSFERQYGLPGPTSRPIRQGIPESPEPSSHVDA